MLGPHASPLSMLREALPDILVPILLQFLVCIFLLKIQGMFFLCSPLHTPSLPYTCL